MYRKYVIILIACVLIVSAGMANAQTDDSAWTRLYGNREAFCDGVLMAEDGGFFLVGSTNLRFEPVRRGDVFLIRTDAAGEVVWSRTYGGDAYEGGLGIIQAGDGNLLISGVAISSKREAGLYWT